MATIKQQKVAKEMVGKGGKSITRAMIESGYSKNTAHTPSKLTRSKGWNELMDQFFPDEKMAKTLGQQIGATKIVFDNHKKYSFPDNDARLRALDQGFKLKQKYKPTQIDMRSFVGWTPEELKKYAKKDVVPARFKGLGFESES